MKEDEEFEMLLDEIPHATSPNLHHLQQQYNNDIYRHGRVHVHGSSASHRIHGMYDDDRSYHPKYLCDSPVSGFTLQSEGSLSSLFSGGHSSSDDGSPTPPSFEETKLHNAYRNPHYSNGLRLESRSSGSPMGKNSMDELGLSENLGRMCIRDVQEDLSMIGTVPMDSYGFQLSDRSLVGNNSGDVPKNGLFEEYRKSFSDYRGLQCSFPVGPMGFEEERRSALLGLQQEYQRGNLLGSSISTDRSSSIFSHPEHCTTPMNYPLQQTMEYSNNVMLSNLQLQDAAFGRTCYPSGIWGPNAHSSIARPSIGDAFFYTQQNLMDFSGYRGGLNSPGSPHLTQPKLPLAVDPLLHCNPPMINGRAGATTTGWSFQSLPSMRGTRDLDAFSFEDSLIIQGKDLNYVINKRCDRSMEDKKGSCNETGIAHPEKICKLGGRSHSGGIPSAACENSSSPNRYCPAFPPLKYNSLLEVQGYVYILAKDQHGCRFLQRKFDEGTPQDVKMIFSEIIDHVVELMMNPFGNYLVQKLLDVCSEEQRMQILLMVTSEPGKLVKISLNMHGTRAVQKLIETLKTRQQISLVITALEPGFLHLIKDLNGNHVVQRCLQCLSNEDNKFIFCAAAKFCIDIATHQHGCCVLQRCITHSTGQHREKLVAKISANGLLLAQDAFGNYVVQYILELKITLASANLISQFEGNYVHLSTQKFSSNVVQKCLQVFGEENRSRIIHELLAASQFEQLLQDPFANYVIQSALAVSKGRLHASLVEAIRPHGAILRTSPYCKRIYSRTFSKK